MEKIYEHLIASVRGKKPNTTIEATTWDFGLDLGENYIKEYSTINNKLLGNPHVKRIEIKVFYKK